MAMTFDSPTKEHFIGLTDHLGHLVGLATYIKDDGRIYLECIDCGLVLIQINEGEEEEEDE
jgi:hypothetical protein